MAVATVKILHEAIHCVNALVDAAPGTVTVTVTVPCDHEDAKFCSPVELARLHSG